MVATILKLTGGVLGAKFRMVDFTASLRLDFPRAAEELLLSLVKSAETDGIITRENDHENVLWAALQRPAFIGSSPTPLNIRSQPPPTPHLQVSALLQSPAVSPPAPLPTHLAPPATSKLLKAVDFPLKHRAVVSIIIKLMEGRPGLKVQMAELNDSLRSQYRGAKEDFLFSLVAKAEEDRIIERETDREGAVWAIFLLRTARDPNPRARRPPPMQLHL
jgi:hypothetical protein